MGSDESDNRRFVLIMDASRDDSLRAIGGVLKEFSLRSGDNLTVLAVLHQVNSPSTLSSIMGIVRTKSKIQIQYTPCNTIHKACIKQFFFFCMSSIILSLLIN